MNKINLPLRELTSKACRILKNEGIGRLLAVSKNYLFGPTHMEAAAADVAPSALDWEKLRLEKLREECRAFPYQPKISIVLPVWNIDPRQLRSSLDSVRAQLYENWELCIAGENVSESNMRELLENDNKRDKRIAVRFLSGHPGVSDLSNGATALATGEFIGFMDQGDELALSALYEVVHLLNRNQDADFIYSDEILLDESGASVYTYYRPDFSMDYLLSHCYINHLSLFRTGLVNKIGGFRKGFDTARYYDLFLRICSETKKVFHIPKVLYLSKQRGSGRGQASLSEVMDSSRKAIQDFLDREGIRGEVCDTGHFNFFRVKREIIGNPKITIVIPTKDRVDLLKRCLSSIEEKTLYKNYDIIIVDNHSREADTFEYLDDLQKRRGVYRVFTFKEDFNFSRINNYAAQHACGEHLLFLNNDVEIIAPEWLEAMLEQSQREDVGCVGAKLLYPDGKLQHVGVVIGLYGGADHIYKWHESADIGYMGHFVSIRNYSAVTAACMMVKRKVFDQIDGFDESYRVGFGDTDFCLRVQEKGYLNVFTPYAELYHHESASRGQSPEIDPHLEDTRRLMKRWQRIIREGDPFYNPNLPLHNQPAPGQTVF
ncbi:MAG: glycosyltransferase family 2 protein [Deltaproteobacteria bacterium]|nr:glycosyltransferase family 2 protein [Deltaproteobacteria bacterium]